MSMPFPPSTRIPAAPALAGAGLPRRVREALEMVHGLVFELVVEPFDRVIPELESRLSNVQDRGAQHSVSLAYIDQVQLLQLRQAGFIAGFMQRIDEELAQLRAQVSGPLSMAESASPIPSFTELRLVEEDETDEVVEVRTIALRHESRAALPLQLLCQRFGVLAASPAFEPGRLPVGPQRLCELMLGAGEANGFGLNLRVALLHEFDRRVLVEYQGIAEALNGLLSRLGIMPGLSYVPLRSRPRTASTEPVLTAAERPHTGWTSAPAGDTDTTTFQLLQELLSSRRRASDRFRGTATLGRPREELDTSAVVGLLDDPEASRQPADFQALRQWLLLRARQQRGEAMSLAPQDADTFELLGLMYAHLAQQLRHGSPAAGMLDQLRLPLLKTALRDPGFFVRSGHPAREVLNAVAESGAAWQAPEDVDPQLLIHLQRTVDDVARPQEDVDNAFRTAVHTLEPQFQAFARRSEISERRNVEAARGKEKLAIARQRAAQVIEDALKGIRLPLFHRNMLRQAWADVLTLGHLRYGDDSGDWRGLVEATTELVRAGSGLATAPPELSPQVEQWLVTVGYHADDAGRIARILTATVHAEDDEAATRTELAMRLKSRARLGEDALPDESRLPPRTDAEQVHFQRLRTLPFGTWMEFNEPEGDVVRRRMSWSSPVTGSVLFVNQRGQRVGESTLDALSRQMAAGTARVVTAADGRLIDRAWRAALQSLRSLVGTRSNDVSTPEAGP
ncbi:MAG: DUF1631 family protein [Lysobacter sp.]|nr:MAG: DUF1631 family protein [Lysobacter sp.]